MRHAIDLDNLDGQINPEAVDLSRSNVVWVNINHERDLEISDGVG